jgi:ABC-2 type transport system ATP-binding protein
MPTSDETVVAVDGLRYRYNGREALAGVSFAVGRAEIFGLLGPNGSGKTTLFRILATLVPPGGGTARVFGADVAAEPAAVRARLGVVFQRPSVDPKLTVRENLSYHGRLYGLGGATLAARTALMLRQLGIEERAGDPVGTLSGGLQRRVELAKSLLHAPEVLLLDEPSTGLDPGARRDFNRYLALLREQEGVTVVLTTHYMEEAERCDRVAILHEGRLVCLGAPEALKAEVGGDVVVIRAPDPAALQARIRTRFGCAAVAVDGSLRIERPRGHEFIRELVDAFPGDIQSVTFGKPTLEDVFIHHTGHRFWIDAEGGRDA